MLAKIRGPKGSLVRLRVRRPGAPAFDVALARDEVRLTDPDACPAPREERPAPPSPLRRGGAAVVPQDLEGVDNPAVAGAEDLDAKRERLLTLIERRFLVDRPTAARWLKLYVANQQGRDTKGDPHVHG